jgi:uncharacterized membrane protein (DUF373 family)
MLKPLDRAADVFERIIIIALLIMLAVMVLMGTVALTLLMWRNGLSHFHGVSDALELQTAMQRGFGGLLVVLLGLELMETIRKYELEHHVRVEVVFFVGLIAIGRHVIQLDYEHADAGQLYGIAALTLALAGGYFLVKRATAAKNGSGS